MLYAQALSCGSSFTRIHAAGTVAPVDKTVTYGTVDNIPGESAKCWITRNLGASQQATAVDDDTEASAGWYWQFNRAQGYQHDGTTRTPNTAWIYPISENSDWESAKDPCALLLGSAWRIPTKTEWTNVDAAGNWIDWNGPFSSGLKMHAAGNLDRIDGLRLNQGFNGYYWSSAQISNPNGYFLLINNINSGISFASKAEGFPLRCLRD